MNTSSPFYGVIYVPSAPLGVCTATVYGALVANVMDQAYGNGTIHYDLDLRNHHLFGPEYALRCHAVALQLSLEADPPRNKL